jgi:hypothetical protein
MLKIYEIEVALLLSKYTLKVGGYSHSSIGPAEIAREKCQRRQRGGAGANNL